MMMMRGFFRMDYTGVSGQGAGSLVLVDGKLAGLDVLGGEYRGTYVEQGGQLSGQVDVSLPSGGHLVTGAYLPPGSPPFRIPFTVSAAAASGAIFQVQAPTGPVNVRLTLISPL